MSDQIVLAWTVSVAGTPIGPIQAAALLAAVPLYQDVTTDPVLGQIFGLNVGADATTNDATSATRTLTLNMTPAFGAPPPFPCHPRTSTPPVLPYLLREAVTLPGSFFVQNGSMTVAVTETQIPSLSIGDSVQFLEQEGVFYTLTAVGATSCSITPAYSGTTANTKAFKEIEAPVTNAAFYSSSDLDTDGVATVPAILAGPGARTIALEYTDSAGNSFTVFVSLTGKRPAAVTLDPGSVDIARIDNIVIISVGGFGNSIGEITLVALSDALPALPSNLPLGTGIGAAETTVGKVGAPVPRTFKTMTDDAQLLIENHLAYLPPSYFALAQQGSATPELEGDFLVTTGSKDVPTTEDQSAVLASGNTIEFAVEPGTIYTIDQVTDEIVKLTEEFSGLGPMSQMLMTEGTKDPRSAAVQKFPTGASLIAPSPAAPPIAAELSAPLAQFVALETAAPPPNPPGAPATVPVPTFLSGLFTRTLQLAMKGVSVTPATISLV